ncbi:hypothetical protein F5I97DRAFT_1930849 [Phlebopus sp. FC_14]|nr:hypothetical protein F5I97DRAFT_1930849 [Phlebopus sp. FC_14]
MIFFGLLLHVAFGVLFMVDRRRKSEFRLSFPLLDGPGGDIQKPSTFFRYTTHADRLGYGVWTNRDDSTNAVSQSVRFPESASSELAPGFGYSTVSTDDSYLDGTQSHRVDDTSRVLTQSNHIGIWGSLNLNWLPEVFWTCWKVGTFIAVRQLLPPTDSQRVVRMIYSMTEVIALVSACAMRMRLSAHFTSTPFSYPAYILLGHLG